jgi:sugar/nucleoside kinase (ribokinase family)
MTQTLVIGSTVVDLIIRLPALPKRGEDINVISVEHSIGGCAYNVYGALRFLKSPALLCSPVGTGIYGQMVRDHLARAGLLPFADLEEQNGCCYCLVEPDGERSFLSRHGAEYLFAKSWMKDIDYSKTGSVFVCGIEVEDPTGSEIVEFVLEHTELELYFAPGPRIMKIAPERMEALLFRRDKQGRGPFLHLNETEALYYAKAGKPERGAALLAEKTGNSVVVTLGERGCYCLSASGERYIPGFPARVVNTVGAGDAHCGALIASLKEGMDIEEACIRANRVGAAVTGMRGAVPELI